MRRRLGASWPAFFYFKPKALLSISAGFIFPRLARLVTPFGAGCFAAPTRQLAFQSTVAFYASVWKPTFSSCPLATVCITIHGSLFISSVWMPANLQSRPFHLQLCLNAIPCIFSRNFASKAYRCILFQQICNRIPFICKFTPKNMVMFTLTTNLHLTPLNCKTVPNA